MKDTDIGTDPDSSSVYEKRTKKERTQNQFNKMENNIETNNNKWL